PGLELAQPAGDARDLFVALAQRTHGLATLSLQAPPLAGDLAQLLAHAFEPALGLARVLLRRRRQRAGQHDSQQCRRPALRPARTRPHAPAAGRRRRPAPLPAGSRPPRCPSWTGRTTGCGRPCGTDAAFDTTMGPVTTDRCDCSRGGAT